MKKCFRVSRNAKSDWVFIETWFIEDKWIIAPMILNKDNNCANNVLCQCYVMTYSFYFILHFKTYKCKYLIINLKHQMRCWNYTICWYSYLKMWLVMLLPIAILSSFLVRIAYSLNSNCSDVVYVFLSDCRQYYVEYICKTKVIKAQRWCGRNHTYDI